MSKPRLYFVTAVTRYVEINRRTGCARVFPIQTEILGALMEFSLPKARKSAHSLFPHSALTSLIVEESECEQADKIAMDMIRARGSERQFLEDQAKLTTRCKGR